MLLYPGDIVIPAHGWEGLRIFRRCEYTDDVKYLSKRRVCESIGQLSAEDVGIIVATMMPFVLIMTSKMLLGWIHSGCLKFMFRPMN